MMTDFALHTPRAARADTRTGDAARKTTPSLLRRVFDAIVEGQTRRARRYVALYAPDLAAQMTRPGFTSEHAATSVPATRAGSAPRGR